MTPEHTDRLALEAAIDAALCEAPMILPDAGFTAAVMQRIAADEATRTAVLSTAQALEGLRAREREERRSARWTVTGLGVGCMLALGSAAFNDGPLPPLTGTTAFALAAAFAVMAWQVAQAMGRPCAPRRR